MSFEPTPTQALMIFAVLARHGECLQAELMPAVKKADREALVKARLLIVGKAGRGLQLTLADAGWAWAADHLHAELPAPQRTLADLLGRLRDHLETSSETLADFIGAKPAPSAGAGGASKAKPGASKAAREESSAKRRSARTRRRGPTPVALRARIEAAYLALTGGRRNTSVRLSKLREELADLDRATVDAALGRILKGDAKASLMRHDDPRQIDEADHDAAYAPVGEPFHVLWISS